ncbi:MAG: hydrogenase expression/formation protein HypE [Eubacteriales bacterium]|nr:hydrogenase expression/formation protein HypE [Eubacteriales bacterium]
MDEIITLDYGSGGKKTSGLIEKMILPAWKNPALSELGDGAVLKGAPEIVFSTDSFVVDPLFFPGGDIGKLAVCGTLNDVAMCGGIPKYLSCSFIIEEGLRAEELEKIIASMKKAAGSAGVQIVTGDTKVVEKGRGDGIYINTSGIGFLKHPGLSPGNIRPGDAVIVSGTVGDHGTAVMLARNGMLQSELKSDCADLSGLADLVLSSAGGPGKIRVLRDPTRGGAATTLNEFIENTGLCIELDENRIPVRSEVFAACEILGLDPLYCANEGKMICICSLDAADKTVEIMRGTKEGENAAIIGTVSEKYPGSVVMKTAAGGSRILRKLTGAQLPRIC